ncbi:uncharacterized protein LOC143025313 [Oratosquilla oratoria]|uniref:uncharacterized protein LOC143025313 n=1 Tax=Oratosquilla oratoria TaxID=337810 RepID=UPI003F7704F0
MDQEEENENADIERELYQLGLTDTPPPPPRAHRQVAEPTAAPPPTAAAWSDSRGRSVPSTHGAVPRGGPAAVSKPSVDRAPPQDQFDVVPRGVGVPVAWVPGRSPMHGLVEAAPGPPAPGDRRGSGGVGIGVGIGVGPVGVPLPHYASPARGVPTLGPSPLMDPAVVVMLSNPHNPHNHPHNPHNPRAPPPPPPINTAHNPIATTTHPNGMIVQDPRAVYYASHVDIQDFLSLPRAAPESDEEEVEDETEEVTEEELLASVEAALRRIHRGLQESHILYDHLDNEGEPPPPQPVNRSSRDPPPSPVPSHGPSGPLGPSGAFGVGAAPRVVGPVNAVHLSRQVGFKPIQETPNGSGNGGGGGPSGVGGSGSGGGGGGGHHRRGSHRDSKKRRSKKTKSSRKAKAAGGPPAVKLITMRRDPERGFGFSIKGGKELGRKLTTRIKEHKEFIKYGQENSTVFLHTSKENPRMAWDNTTIVSRSHCSFRREIIESFLINHIPRFYTSKVSLVKTQYVLPKHNISCEDTICLVKTQYVLPKHNISCEDTIYNVYSEDTSSFVKTQYVYPRHSISCQDTMSLRRVEHCNPHSYPLPFSLPPFADVGEPRPRPLTPISLPIAGVGVYVSRVEKAGPAWRAGLRPGDLLLAVNNTNFTQVTHQQAITLLKSCEEVTLTVLPTGQFPTSVIVAQTYTWVTPDGRPTSPPPEYNPRLHAHQVTRVGVELGGAESLGLMIRGGVEYGLGIFVTGVDEGSAAHKTGLKVGDQILEVNGESFLAVTHDTAVNVLKYSRCLDISLRRVAKVPHSCTTYDRLCWSQSHNGENQRENLEATLAMIEEKSLSVLNVGDHARLKEVVADYAAGRIPVEHLLSTTRKLLNSSDKMGLLTELREVVRNEDQLKFDRTVFRESTEPAPPEPRKSFGESIVMFINGIKCRICPLPTPSQSYGGDERFPIFTAPRGGPAPPHTPLPTCPP